MEVLIQEHVGLAYEEMTFNNPDLFRNTEFILKLSDKDDLRKAIIAYARKNLGELDFLAYEITQAAIVDADTNKYAVKVVYVKAEEFEATWHRRVRMLYADDDD